MTKVTQISAFATAILAWAGLLTLTNSIHAQTVEASVWGKMRDGGNVKQFVLTNTQKTRVMVAELGAILISVETLDRDGKSGNITLSYRSLDEALAGGVYGPVIGRFANRISGGGFTLDGKRFDLGSINQKAGVHIHGGKTGFHRQLWQGTPGNDKDGSYVILKLTSDDGHEGYPGKVDVAVTYRLNENNTLRIDYEGTTDKPTHLSLTNHAYFNLSGKGDVLGHRLRMISDSVVEVSDQKISTGKRLPIAGSPYDFPSFKSVGKDIAVVPDGGYDQCFVVSESNTGVPKEIISFHTTRQKLNDILAVRTSPKAPESHCRNLPCYPRFV